MWTVQIPKKVAKQIDKLPQNVRPVLRILLDSIRSEGAVQGVWPNYSKLGKNRHHCHIKKGKPCYVVVWEVKDKTIRLIEVEYVGTHENAPY